MTEHPEAAPAYLVDEIAARLAYDALPWRARLVTPPPVGLPGRHVARVVAWCVGWWRSQTSPKAGPAVERDGDEGMKTK